jgi:hypothetical protein
VVSCASSSDYPLPPWPDLPGHVPVKIGGTGRGRASRCASGDVGVGKGPWPSDPGDAHCGSARGVVWMPLAESWCDHVGEAYGEGVSALGGEEGSHVWRGPPM